MCKRWWHISVKVIVATAMASNSLAVAKEPVLGAGVHSMMRSEEIQRNELDLMSSLAMNTVRTDAQWKYAELSKGSLKIPASWDSFVNVAIKRGLNPLLVLDYGNKWYGSGDKPRSKEDIAGFVRYAKFVVAHFRGRVKAYEVWNEWDNTTGGFPAGTPEDYARVFAAVHPAIKQIDKSALVLMGAGIEREWYLRLAELGVVAASDGVSVHPYNYEPTLAPEVAAQYLTDLERELAHMTSRPSVDIYVTEIGWPTYFFGRRGYSEDKVGVFAMRTALLLSSLPFVKGVWWYDLVDDGNSPFDKQDQFGLFRSNLSPKKASYGIRAATNILRSYALLLSPQSKLADGLTVIQARKKDGGSDAVIGWNVGSSPYSMQAHCGKGVNVSIEKKVTGYDDIGLSEIPFLITSVGSTCSVQKVKESNY